MSAFFIGYSEQDIHSNHTNESNVFFCTYFDSDIHFIELGTLEDILTNVVQGKGNYCIVPFKGIEDIVTETNNLMLKYQQERIENSANYIHALNMINELITENVLFKNTVTNSIHTKQSVLGHIRDDITNMYQPNNLIDKWNFNENELFACLRKGKNELFVASNENELKENYLTYLQETHDAYLVKLSHEQKSKSEGLLKRLLSLFRGY